MVIYDTALGTPVTPPAGGWNLLTAIQQPNLTNANGAASILGDAFSGYTVTWQIKIANQQFAAGRSYTIVLTGASDVVQNQQAVSGTQPPSENVGTFRVNIN